MGPKVDGKYAVRVEDKFGRKKPTGIKRLSSDGMRSDAALPRAKELLKKQPDQTFKIGRFTVTSFIKPAKKKVEEKPGVKKSTEEKPDAKPSAKPNAKPKENAKELREDN